MQYKNAAIIVAGLAAQQVASSSWTGASSYSCPGNTNNHCGHSQEGGYDWSSLQPGDFSSYGDNSFSGFSCSKSFGKRDLLSKRGFQPKCITGNLDDHPSMSSGDDGSFSIDQMQISSSHEADVDCEYGMPDGSTCHETHSCSEGGSIFQNTQCGGAKSVTFKPGKNAPPGCSIGVHSVGFHCGPPASTVPPYTPPASSSVPAPSSSVPASSSAPCYGSGCSSASVPSSSAPAPPCYGKDCSSSAAPSSSAPAPSCYGAECSSSAIPSSSAPAPPCYGKDCSSSAAPSSSAPAPPCYGKDCSSSAVPVSSSSAPAPPCYGAGCSSSAAPSSSAPAPPCYGAGCSSSAAPSSSAPAPPCYGKDCSSSAAPSSSAPAPPCYGAGCSSSAAPSSSAPPPPCYGADCSSSTVPASSSVPGCYGGSCSSSQGIPGYGSSSSASPASSSTAPGYPTPSCPGLLPRCLNTWMYMSGCKDNADSNCFCGNQEFITKVMGCIGAWASSDSDAQAAASYLMGLCAPHVPSNPAIITACPSTVTPGPTPVAYPSSSSAAPITSKPGKPAPCTTITYSSSVVVPATYTTGVSTGCTIPGSSYTTSLVTTVTVPQVHLTTDTVTVGGTTTCSVGLGGGAPSSAPAYTTPASSAGAYPSSVPPPTGYGTTFGTSWAPSASSTWAPVPATGAGMKTSASLVSLALGAIAALAAL